MSQVYSLMYINYNPFKLKCLRTAITKYNHKQRLSLSRDAIYVAQQKLDYLKWKLVWSFVRFITEFSCAVIINEHAKYQWQEIKHKFANFATAYDFATNYIYMEWLNCAHIYILLCLQQTLCNIYLGLRKSFDNNNDTCSLKLG